MFEAVVGYPEPETVAGLVLVPFAGGRCVLTAEPGLLAWAADGSSYLEAAYRVPLAGVGVRMQGFHPFAARASPGDGLEVAGWVDGELRDTGAARIVIEPDAAAARLRTAGRGEDADLVEWAWGSLRGQTDEEYLADMRMILETSYLAATTLEGGSGFGGDAERWRQNRRVVADAVHRDGTFLDVGCANGLLMESVVAWAASDGHAIEPYGLDLSDRLAAEARRRLPQWADRIWVGNCATWDPPFRFDFVCTRLEYVREPRRAEHAARVLRDFVAPGGRLIVQSYGLTADPDKVSWSVGDHLRSWGFVVGGEPTSIDTVRNRVVRIAFIDA